MIKFKESETIEFKTSTAELKEAVVSISAILSKHGRGELYFGIRDDSSVAGQMIGRSTLRDVTEAILTHLEPKIFPDVKNEKDPRQGLYQSRISRYPSSLFCLLPSLHKGGGIR